jgi:hypothetical protein
MGARSSIGWLFHGRANTTATLDSLTADLQALQHRVDQLTASIERDVRGLRDQQLAEFDKVREVVVAATDDLSERIAALHREAES